MAGDWIKMRGNLWDDPRVARICDMTDSGEAAVVGALYWLWSTADQHTEDGCMPGLTLRQIDRKTGLQGFGAALVSIGWLADDPQGVVIANFEEHNGSSAKKRCQTAQRVAKARLSNAHETQQDEVGNAPSVTGALAREEKRREEQIQEDPPASRVPPADAGKPARASKRCPESFAPGDEVRQWATVEAPRADFARELAKFKDHTFQRGHSDWPAAFRNWLRRASDDAAKRPQSFMAEKQNEMAKWFKGTSLDTSTQQDYIDAAPLTLR
jgi:hypothetical protein